MTPIPTYHANLFIGEESSESMNSRVNLGIASSHPRKIIGDTWQEDQENPLFQGTENLKK